MIEFLYEDEDLFVVKKPAGLPVETASLRQKDLVSELKNYRARKGEPPYIGLIHRLDQPVEGVMVLAKTKEAAGELEKQLTSEGFGKIYLALAENAETSALDFAEGEKGTLTDYLQKDPKTNTSKVVTPQVKGAKKAILDYEVLQCQESQAFLKITLHTGRHHQIRVQLAHAGWPLLGDQKYGKPSAEFRNPALCASEITFRHPRTGQNLSFHTEPSWLSRKFG